MIQRIQTIYLLLAFGCIVTLLFFPLFSIVAVADGPVPIQVSADFGANGLILSESIPTSDIVQSGKLPVYLLYISLAMLTAISLLLFKKRKTQLVVSRINLLLHIFFLIGVYAFYYFGGGMIQKALSVGQNESVTLSLGVGFYFLVASIPFIILAIRGIKHDENLVKSLDRLR